MAVDEQWQLHQDLQLRWDDFDRYGHLNHAVYAIFLAEGRVALMESVLGRETMDFVLVRAEIDYLREVAPSESRLVLSSRFGGVGTKSVSIDQRLQLEDGTVVAQGHAVVVAWDMQARTSREISDEERALLSRPSG